MEQNGSNGTISLSPLAETLVNAIEQIQPRSEPDDYTRLTVSRAVSFVALIYEKVRNVIEYREDHLIRRAAIERILRRRLSINPSGENEAENLLRELLWARYFPKNSLGEDDADTVQQILDRYAILKVKLLEKKSDAWKEYLSRFLMDFITCEIEESLSQDASAREAAFTYFIFQTLQKTVSIAELPENQKDSLLYVAIEQEYRKSDRAYQRYHIFSLFYNRLSEYSEKDLEVLIPRLPNTMKKIDEMIHNPNVHKLRLYIKKQLPAFHILFDVLQQNATEPKVLMTNKQALHKEVEKICTQKYGEIREKIKLMTIRSVIYLFVLRIIVAALIEVPLIRMLTPEPAIVPIVANILFPPLFLLMIVLWYRLPDANNTLRIFQRILQLITDDAIFGKKVAMIARKAKTSQGIAGLLFTGLYIAGLVLLIIGLATLLTFLNFHPISQFVFVFFFCMGCYFAFRINQVIKEYTLLEKPGILDPVIDFFFLPMVSVGKELDKGISKLNFLTLIFDFLIEIPFKLIIEVVEEWFSYMRSKKEEIV